jgi:hypothetical protein
MSEKLIKPYILGIGGTTRAGSTSEKALRISLEIAQEMGARIQLVAGLDLDFPMYSPHLQDRSDKAMFLIEQLRQCDGLIVSSPSYHGSVSGLVKGGQGWKAIASDMAGHGLDMVWTGSAAKIEHRFVLEASNLRTFEAPEQEAR